VKVALYAYIQLVLISMNTWHIANGKLIASIVFSFLIGLAWTMGVNGVAGGGTKEKLFYAAGGSLGTGTGVLLSTLLY
jgi:hypothetical protein